jgi:hypothetical protein
MTGRTPIAAADIRKGDQIRFEWDMTQVSGEATAIEYTATSDGQYWSTLGEHYRLTQATEPQQWIRGAWMQTYTGQRFYPTAAEVDDVDPIDIAHALSLLCRYNGHVQRFYSVAEHCVHLSRAVAPEHALWALLHDATEAYVGDMVRPLKVQIPAYVEVEDRLMTVIADRFDLCPKQMPDEVKDADTRILLDERDVLMPNVRYAWDIDDLEPLGVVIEGWAPATAEARYLDRLHELGVFR